MKLQKSLKIALNIIFHSKLRSWLTVIGIVIGVAAIASIVSIGAGFEKDVQRQLGGLGSDIIYVTPGFDRAIQCPGPRCGELAQFTREDELTNKEIQIIKSIPDVQYVDSGVTGSEEVYYLGETATFNIEGV